MTSNELTLEWVEAGQVKTQIIREQQPSKQVGTVRLGRDLARCDVVLQDPTVSGLHVEIFFDHRQNSFKIRNLRTTNPPSVDGQLLVQGEAILNQGSRIRLGQVEIKVLPEASAAPEYGLQCPKCRRILAYDRLESGCPFDGTSLAGADSVLMMGNR